MAVHFMHVVVIKGVLEVFERTQFCTAMFVNNSVDWLIVNL